MPSTLLQAVTEINALAQADSDHFFKTDWLMVDMNLTANERRLFKFYRGMAQLRTKCKIRNNAENNRHIKFVLLNLRQALAGSKPLALACPSSKEGVIELLAKENPQRLKLTLVNILEALEAASFVKKLSGQDYARRHPGGGLVYNRFLPTPKLVSEIIEPLKLLDFSPELIGSANFVVVTSKETIRYDDEIRHELPLRGFVTEAERKVIKDSNSFLRSYNRLLMKTDIRLSRGEVSGNYSRVVYRKFCRGSLKYGGRLYGGFWQSLPSGKRGEIPSRKDICLDGEEAIELDFKAFHINMLYAWEGMEPYRGDAYQLTNWHRDVVKQCILIALNCRTKSSKAVLSAYRKEMAEKPHLQQYYPGLLKGGYEKLKQEFVVKHPAIAKHLHNDAGVELQRQDSEIAMRVIGHMMELHERGIASYSIPVLCVHDSFICPASQETLLENCMRGAYEWVMKTKTAPAIEKVG
jgi:hypothetical protein